MSRSWHAGKRACQGGEKTCQGGKRPWTAGKPKKKPDYDAEAVTKELLDAVVKIYSEGDEHKSLRTVADEMEAKGYGSISPAKIKKLLITANVYKTETTEQIGKLKKDGHSVEQIMAILNLSRAAVNNNLPYEKVVYKMDESGGDVSVNADRVRLYKKRKRSCEKLRTEPNSENLWNAVVAFENYPLKTTSGLDYTYSFKKNRHGQPGNELQISRKSKTITRSSVEMALDVVMAAGEIPVKMSTPKELGVFGASYIYPLFIRFGLIEHVGSSRRGGRRKKSNLPISAKSREINRNET